VLRSIRTLAGLAASLLLAVPALALAQTGRISGTISAEGATPIVAAQILVPALGLASRSSETGTFEITGVPAGTYDVKVYRMGYSPVSKSAVVVTGGQNSKVEFTMKAATMQLQEVVVSAARHAEKVTDAAATVTALNAEALDNRIGNTYSLALRSAPGLDVTQVGVTSVFVNGRGFNNRFNTRWLTLEDGRVAVLAETSLPIGEHTAIPKLDVASMEMITGPGSALYGANASNGLLSVRTKDPREYPGFSAEFSGGSRDLYDIQTRYAGSTKKFGYKVATEYQSAADWENLIYYPAVVAGGPILPETIADFHTDVTRVSGALDYYLPNGGKLQFNNGYSRRNGLGDSNSGHYQIEDYTYFQQQLSYSSPRWFGQVYTTHSNSGDTYQMYAAVPDQARNPTLTGGFDSPTDRVPCRRPQLCRRTPEQLPGRDAGAHRSSVARQHAVHVGQPVPARAHQLVPEALY
jgi:iron complex outermembrane receptor protein